MVQAEALLAEKEHKAMVALVTQAVPAERKRQVALSARGPVVQTATLKPVDSVLAEMATPAAAAASLVALTASFLIVAAVSSASCTTSLFLLFVFDFLHFILKN